MSRSLQGFVSAALILANSLALAEAPAQEPALAITSQDPTLDWGPCPAFIPQGCEIAVLHGDPGKANTDVFFKVPAQRTRGDNPKHRLAGVTLLGRRGWLYHDGKS